MQEEEEEEERKKAIKSFPLSEVIEDSHMVDRQEGEPYGKNRKPRHQKRPTYALTNIGEKREEEKSKLYLSQDLEKQTDPSEPPDPHRDFTTGLGRKHTLSP